MNGNKENARVVKTYVCKCGEVNRFSFETDFNFTEIRIDANCQGCGKDISISVEKHLAGNCNANGGLYPFNQANSNYNGNYSSVPSSSLLESPTQYQQDSSTQAPSPNTIPDFNFDALTTAAESMNSTQDTSTAQATTTSAPPALPDYSGAAEILGSLSSDMVDGIEDEEHVPEVADPAPPLAAKVTTIPARKPVLKEQVNEEDKDLLSKEEENYGEDAGSDEREAFIDLFGRL